MSDFDEEAERERLRERFEREDERRQATEQMSELLLKGATMTNAHCDDCGDPIFRYDGTEFCPTCEKRVDRDEGETAGAAGGEGQAGADADQAGADRTGADARAEGDDDADRPTVEVTTPDPETTVKFGGDDESAEAGTESPADEAVGEPGDPTAAAGSTARDAADAGASAEDATADAGEPSTGPEPTVSGGTDADGAPDVTPATSAAAGGSIPSVSPTAGGADDSAEREASDPPASVGGPLGRAQVALARTAERYARLALEADTPREAREHLQTAREAGEALAATEN